jgi:hypothetical protein
LGLEPLRSEIVESEKNRVDFLKYKLVAVAALGAVGLGLKGSGGPPFDPQYILCIIPFVCIYVDALCCHNTLRILVIAKYLEINGDPYEAYIARGGKQMRDVFGLEDWGLNWSTLLLTISLGVWGLANLLGWSLAKIVPSFASYHDISNPVAGGLFLSVGILGTIASFILKNLFKRHELTIRREGKILQDKGKSAVSLG